MNRYAVVWSVIGALTLGGATLGCATESATAEEAGNPAKVAAAVEHSKGREAKPANSTGKPMAFVATTGPGGPKIIAFDMAGKKVVWSQAAEVTARIEVGSSIIIATQKGGELVARDVSTGAVRWQEKPAAGASRVGYAIDGDAVFYVATVGGRGRGREAEVVALDGATGAVRWRTPLPSSKVGGPAARGGLVAIPFRSQYVTLLDASNGQELAQVLSRDEAATFVRSLPEGLFFGSKGIFLLSGETADGSHKKPGYMQASLPKFVRATYAWDMYEAGQSNYSAADKNRVLWRAAVNGTKSKFLDGLALVHSFRFFFGFDANTGALRWAYNHPRVEAVSSDDTGKSIVFITSDGGFGALDPQNGQRLYSAKVPNAAVRGATFDADGFAPPAGDEPPPPLPPTLASIIWDPDRRFSDVKLFAVEELSKLPGREVTGELLKILDKEGMPPATYQKAADALVARKDAAAIDLYVAALGTHADYADDKKTHGLDVLAKAVGALKAKEAAPALVSHLRQPDTGSLVVAEIADAVVAMEARDAVPALRDFLLEYRADPAFAGDPAPLIGVTEALLKLGGPAERTTLLFVAEEPKTLDALRTHIRRALAQTASGAAAPGAAPAAPSAPAAKQHGKPASDSSSE